MPTRRNAIYVLVIFSLLIGLFTGRAFFFSLAWLFSGLLLISFVWSWLSVRWINISRKTRARRAQAASGASDSTTASRRRSPAQARSATVRHHGAGAVAAVAAVAVRAAVVMARSAVAGGRHAPTAGAPA